MDEPPRFRQSKRKFARAQRQDMTRAETMLWRAVRKRSTDTAFAGKRRSGPISRISFVLREKSSSKRTAAASKDGRLSTPYRATFPSGAGEGEHATLGVGDE
jgi:hypothetical protein